MGRFGRVAGGVALTAALMVGAGVTFAPAPGTAQDEDLRPTVEAMQTQISTLQTQVADLMPPTPKPGQPTPTKAARPAGRGDGTKEFPASIGTWIEYGVWSIRVVTVEAGRDAQRTIQSANGYLYLDDPNSVPVLTQVEVTYNGVGRGNIFWDLTLSIVTADGLAYDDNFSCSVPNSQVNAPELTTGATFIFSFCTGVPEEKVDDMLLSVVVGYDGEPQYFVLHD